MKLKICQVGMFKLPGVVVEREENINDEQWQQLQLQMDEWAVSEQGTGKRMTETLWSFRKESQRDWFILKWSDS